jgi:hypothetical protein
MKKKPASNLNSQITCGQGLWSLKCEIYWRIYFWNIFLSSGSNISSLHLIQTVDGS